MGLFDKIFPKQQMIRQTQGFFKPLTAYQPSFRTWNGALYESELVRSAIDARARHISKLKVEAIGTAKPRLQRKLAIEPNSFQTWGQFLYRLSTILDMQNTAFIVPVIGSFGEITGFFPVLPSCCEVVQYNNEPFLKYTFSNGQTACIEYRLCGVMTKYQYENDFFGASNRALSDTMALIDIQKQGITEAVKNSATYRFMAQLSNFAKAEDLAKERKRFTAENLASEAGNNGLLLFPNTYGNIQQIKNAPYTVDAAQMELIQTNVYNYFGVNKDILQNSAIGDSWSAFYEGCVEVFALQFSEVLSRICFTENEIQRGSKVIATANRLQYMSNADKLSVSAQMADRGIMARNEIREIWNLSPIPGGDVATIRGEYYMIDEKGDPITKEDSE